MSLILPEIRYSDPAHPVVIAERKSIERPRVLVVLCSYIPKGLNAAYSSRLFGNHTYVPYSHNRLACLDFVLRAYHYMEAGAAFDLVVIDNDSPSRRALKFFETSDVLIISRENTYHSFGAYKTAWQLFGENYDYFVFHEMDWMPARKNWLRYLIDIWESDSEIGMIGNLIESREWTDCPKTNGQRWNNQAITTINKNRKVHYNLDSEYLFTDRTVLSRMDEMGWLLFPCKPEGDLEPQYNELAFQQPILEMGYKLRCFNDGKHTMFYGFYNHGWPPEKWSHGLENLAPYIPEQTRLFIPEIRDYFAACQKAI